MPRRKSSRRTRVRRNKDGTLNKKDLAAISEKYMFKDNPWMKEVLKENFLKSFFWEFLQNSFPPAVFSARFSEVDRTKLF